MHLRRILALSLCLSSPVLAQTAGTAVGVVLARDGTPIASASISLQTPDAPPRPAVTAADGTFTLKDLPSGTYDLRVSAPSFADFQQTSIPIATGRATHITAVLTLASAQQSVTVTAANSSFDTTQTSSVVNIDRDRVEELPIPSRNYLSFVLLSPQVAPANPALAQGGLAQATGAFSFGGLRPGSNSIYLDQVNDNDEFTGGSRTQLSPEAINDFQIVNHGFSAESGGAAGGSIDVQTRTGLNRLHGDAFTFVQNGALNATPPLGLPPSKPEETRVRAGLALGGPIQHDRTFYYLAAEQEIAHGEDVSDLTPETRTAIDSALQQSSILAALTLQPGFFPTTDQETELSARLDRTLSPRHAIALRYAFTNTRSVADAFQVDEQSDRTARGSSFLADHSINSTITSALSDKSSNRFSFEVAQRRVVERTGSPSSPGFAIPGLALVGTPYSGNDRRFETHIEFADTFSLQLKHHLFEAGARVDRVAVRADTPEAAHGFLVFPSLAALQTATPDFFAQTFGNPDTNLAEIRLAAFVQDHWTPTAALTLDFGLRYDLNRLPAPVSQAAPVDLSPRLGVAWTPVKSVVIRSGFGLFYDRFLFSTIDRLQQFDGSHAFTQIAEDRAAAAIYRTGRLPSAPIPGVAPSIWRAQPNLRNPYSEVASFSVEQALPFQTTLTGEYQYVHGIELGRSSNVNLAPPVLLTADNAASLGVSAPTPQQLNRPVFGPARLDPRFDAVNEFATSGSSTYNATSITINRQFQDDLQIMAGYTFSKTIDDGSYDLEQSPNPYAARDQRALSLEDQRHRLTLSGLYLIGPDLGDPADAVKNANPGPLMKILNGLEFAPILSVSSGFRANPVTGLDSAREHIFPFATRPAGYARNSLSTPPQIDFDLRILKMVPVAGGHLDIVAESFNLPNHRNVTLVDPVFGSALTAAPHFGKPLAASTPRRVQFSLDYEF